jgi:hypothetical protein
MFHVEHFRGTIKRESEMFHVEHLAFLLCESGLQGV